MAFFRTCNECGCSLDPGEGNKCSDCLEVIKNRENYKETLPYYVYETESGQMQLKGRQYET